MTHEVKLHVGYIGKTRAGERVEIVHNDGHDVFPFDADNGHCYKIDGDIYQHATCNEDIIGPWEEPAAKVGEWIGWNGGECPVHPETVVECVWHNGIITVQNKLPASEYVWDGGDYQTIAYRIITPYVEPKKAREFWVKGCVAYGSYTPSAIHVREVLDDE